MISLVPSPSGPRPCSSRGYMTKRDREAGRARPEQGKLTHHSYLLRSRAIASSRRLPLLRRPGGRSRLRGTGSRRAVERRLCKRTEKCAVCMASSKLQAFWNHPAGPKTIHFWAPTFKWGISIANVADFAKPPEMISYPQQVVVACSGIIWARWGMVITPINWNLSSVNAAMAVTGMCQLSRKIRNDYFSDEKDAAASLRG